MEILNIDDFATVKRQVTLKGVSYDVEEINVQQFIDNLKASEALEAEAGKEDKFSAAFERSIGVVRQSIPSMSEEIVRTLKLPAMTAVMKFIRGEKDPTPAEIEAAAKDAVTEEAAEAAKKPD